MKRIKRIGIITMVALLGFVGIATMTNNHGKYFEIAKNIEIYTNLYREINTYYVDDIDPAKLMRTGLDAMLESLDPYTNYISESEIEGIRYMTTGKYGGVGALVRKVGDKAVITDPHEGFPAQKAGLKAGDIIIAVDGKSAKGKSPDDISDVLKGAPGTKVTLTVERPGSNKQIKVTMTREEVRIPNVPYSGMVSDNVGYVSLTTFTQNAGKNVADAVKRLKMENPNVKGMILDLRGNGGGLLTEAINVSNVFVPKGEQVVMTRGKVKDWDRSFKTLNRPVDENIGLVVLVDKGSASASEIVSGVIQDLDRGVLIGQRTFGKGLVQNTRDVGYNSKVKLTTAKYYIPSGRCIQAVSYKNGEPVDIPDAKRTQFKTSTGRTVLDGGGVKPDILLQDPQLGNVLRSLENESLIFDFVTQYQLKHPTIPAAKDFRFTDYAGFLDFVAKRGFNYETESEALLNELEETSKDEFYLNAIKNELKAAKDKILSSKKNDLSKYKKEITNQIEKEIVGRYYYSKGMIEVGLRNDKEIKEAVMLLNDPAKIKSILKK